MTFLKKMSYFLFELHFTFLLISHQLKYISALPTFKEEEDPPNRVLLRRELDEITQALLIERDPNRNLYHSYIFNSGVGNREELQVEMLRRNPDFASGEGVVSWQSVKSAGHVYLLGRKLTSISLVVSSTQILPNRSAQFTEYITDVGANISSSAIFIRSDLNTSQQDVIAVIAIDSSSADLLWFRVRNKKLELIKRRNHYTKTTAMAALSVGGRNQLVLVDAGSPANVDVYEIAFGHNNSNVGLRLLQNFSLICECLSLTVFNVGRQLFLTFPLPCNGTLIVYWLISDDNTSHFKHHKTLSLPRVSQVSAFSLAQQVYLAVNGDQSYVLRVTESGDFIAELSLGYVSEWLVVPVLSYRDDVALFTRSANLTELYVWAGTVKGFKSLPIPECCSCLEGDWLGALSVPFLHQHSVLIPQATNASSLITIVTSLLDTNNPVLLKMTSMMTSINQYEDIWRKIQHELSETEKTLRYVLNPTGRNNITAKWQLKNLETPELYLDSLIEPTVAVETLNKTDLESTDLSSIENAVKNVVERGEKLFKTVDERERQVWGLDGFTGKINVKGRLVINNLTVGFLNRYSMNDLLKNSFRKSIPKTIQGNVVAESVQTENLIIRKINRDTVKEGLKFNDKPLVIKGNITFLGPIVVEGDLQLRAGGKINDIDLSELCDDKENCSVYPALEQDDNKINEDNVDLSQTWKKVLGGKNLTVTKVNGVTWKTLSENVIYKNKCQNVSGIIIVNGTLISEKQVWIRSVKKQYNLAESESQNLPILQMPPDRKLSTHDSILLDDILSNEPGLDVIFSDLEVLGTVTCTGSEWGVAASDIVRKTADPIQIQSVKEFNSGISVARNLDVKGTVAGVNMSDFLTSDTTQLFDGTTTLQGNITLLNVSLDGLWNGVNVSYPSYNITSLLFNGNSLQLPFNELTVGKLRVTETFNGRPVSEFVYTKNNVTSVKKLAVASADVTEDITVAGKVCNQTLNEFDKFRLSIKRDQNITGNFVIDTACSKGNFNVSELKIKDKSYLMSDIIGSVKDNEELHLPALHVDGDITTDFGMNGYNLLDIAANAVWLHSNNEIKGPLIFKDELIISLLECQGFFNKNPYYRLDDTDVVYKTNGTVHLSGKIKFSNFLNISEDLNLEDINGHKVEDILTKTTEQVISGDVFVTGNVVIDGESTLGGWLNNLNISYFGAKCLLANSTILYEGDAKFEDTVDVQHFSSAGSMNGVDFDKFTESMVDVSNITLITEFKNFTGKTTIINSITVQTINNYNWEDFLLNAVNQNAFEDLDLPITFKEKVVAKQMFVDYDLDADTVNGLNLNEWQSNAIFIKENFTLARPLHLASASSLDNISVTHFGDIDLDKDTINLKTDQTVSSLRVKSLRVIEEATINSSVNGHDLKPLESNTLKVSGDQIVTAEIVAMTDVYVSGNVETSTHVNNFDLREVVTLDSDQTLHGSYRFECVEAMQNLSAAGLVSELNLTEWVETAVVQGQEQEVTGLWRLKGHLDLRGPVTGPGKLGDLNLPELADNITRDLINVHEEMKVNLTSVCQETNQYLNKARNQTSELLYLDISQEIIMSSAVTLVKHFKSGADDFLAVCENSCTTTIFKWDKIRGRFSKVHSTMLGFAVSQLVELQHNNLTYLLVESSELITDCHFTGRHLWLFSEDQLKHVSSIDFVLENLLQGRANFFYTMNSTGIFKWNMGLLDQPLFKISQKWETHSERRTKVDINKILLVRIEGKNPLMRVRSLPIQNFTELVNLESALNAIPELQGGCSDEVLSLSVSPNRQFIAVATTEQTQVPRHSDNVKIYQQSGQLFDNLPAQRVSLLQWLNVPDQTWLVVVQNHSLFQLFHLKEGFQLKLSTKLEASDILSLSLPLASKVSMQPYLVVKSKLTVKILHAILQGDPFLGENMICSFNETLLRVPGT